MCSPRRSVTGPERTNEPLAELRRRASAGAPGKGLTDWNPEGDAMNSKVRCQVEAGIRGVSITIVPLP